MIDMFIFRPGLTLVLQVANLVNTELCKNPEKLLKPWHICTPLCVILLWKKVASALEGLLFIDP